MLFELDSKLLKMYGWASCDSTVASYTLIKKNSEPTNGIAIKTVRPNLSEKYPAMIENRMIGRPPINPLYTCSSDTCVWNRII